jgi:uncharacterized RDD family membrane protein YckC
VSALHCPRCRRETLDPLGAFCRACGAPLRLSEEPPAPPLSEPLAIDRRGDAGDDPDRPRAAVAPPPLHPAPRAPARPPPRALGELADLDASQWEMGRPAVARPEPAFAAPAPPAAPVAAPPQRNVATGAAGARAARPVVPGPAAPTATAPPARAQPATATANSPATPTSPPTSTSTSPPTSPPTSPAPAPAPAPARSGFVEVHVRRAEPWRRVVAWVVDGVPFLAAGAALAGAFVREARVVVPGAAAGLDLLDFVARERVIVLSVAAVVVLALGVYATLCHALAGATLGKRLVGLRVVGPDGARPTLARSATRSALAVLSAAALGLGFLLALFVPSGRGLHDLLARTWVVDAQP